MLNLVNAREVNLISGPSISATVPPHAPGDTDVVIMRVVAPSNGRVKDLVACVAAPGTAGTGSGHKQMLRVRNAGFGGAATDVVTDDIVLKDLTPTPDDLPAAGTVRAARGTNVAANVVLKGQILEVFHEAAGTIGTGAAATFSVLQLNYEAAQNIDAADRV